MADISKEALEKAKAKVLQLIPGAPVETFVRFFSSPFTYLPSYLSQPANRPPFNRSATYPKKPKSRP